MTDTPAPPNLRRLASLSGIIIEFEGVDGRPHAASAETLRALLRALGKDVRTERDALEQIEALGAGSTRILEPVVVSRSGHSVQVPVNLVETVDADAATVVLERESGQRGNAALVDVLASGGPSAWLQLERAGWPDLEPGLHTLSIEAPGLEVQALLVVAPLCPAVPRRSWGAFMPLHALRGADDWGIGSYSDLAELASWVDELGGDFVGTLPLYPVDRPVSDPSPYLPVSRLAYNELCIDPVAVPELAASAAARRLVESPAFGQRLGRLRAGSLVEYAMVQELKDEVFALLFDELVTRQPSRLHDLHAFGEAHPELSAYARFRAGRATEPDGAATRDPRFHLYLQWLAFGQLRVAGAAGAALYADMPVGVRADGFDAQWAPTSFAEGVQGGAPPDAFFSEGQTWGFRPLHPDALRADGYRYLLACLRRAFAAARLLRLDHVAGLHRLYWVPDGMPATEGAYVRYHSEEMRALVCLEAWRSGSVVVGEDLGTVPEDVRADMRTDRMLRTWVLQFESSEGEPLPDPPARSLASLSTHDLPRFPTFLEGGDLGTRDGMATSTEMEDRRRWRSALERALGAPEATPEDLTAGCLAHLAAGPADLVLVDLEELWGERAPQNRPGTGPEAHNWSRRTEPTLREMRGDRTRYALLESFEALRRGAPVDAPEEVAAS